MAVSNKDGVGINPRALAINPELELIWDQFLIARAEFKESLISTGRHGHRHWGIWMLVESGEPSLRLDLVSPRRIFQLWRDLRPLTNGAGEILVASGPLGYRWTRGDLRSCILGVEGVLPELSSTAVTLTGYDDQSEALNEFWSEVQRSIGHDLFREVNTHD